MNDLATTTPAFIANSASTFPPRPMTDDEWAAVRIEGRWTPTTLAAAEWAAQRLVESRRDLDVIKTEVAEYVASVRSWADTRLKAGHAKELAESIELFEAGLTAYARSVRAASINRKGEPRVKTVKLPTATLETKAPTERKPKFTITDQDALVKWAMENDTSLLEVDPKRIQKLLIVTDSDNQEHIINGDGQPIPGVSYTLDDEPREPSVTIRLHSA